MLLPHHAPFDAVLNALTAAGEATRLRLLALLAEAELTVSELVAILGQSQPRVSRHLKLLAEAGLVERHREGSWVFFLMSQSGPAAGFARDIVARLAPADPHLLADRARLAEVREARAEVRRLAISPRKRPIGMKCAPCTCPKSASRPRCLRPSAPRL